ncbi:MAG: DNA-directed RNA polymerase subunit beta' [bacterium]|nr:DNA-directed RNA polymerase subunit beta' [bacterium]
MKEFINLASIKIGLASPDRIREISYGVVKKPETINYRTLKPERDGLFCEKIFGTTKEWECSCGKFKGIRYKGVVCDRCGVEVTHFKVRRERMGHIELATPIAHIWFYSNIPSRIGLLLNISINDLRSVIYCERIIIVDIDNSVLKEIDPNINQYIKNKLKVKDVYPEEIFYEIINDIIYEIIYNKHTNDIVAAENKAKESGDEFVVNEHIRNTYKEQYETLRDKFAEYIVDIEKKEKTIGEMKAGIIYGLGAYAIKKLLQEINLESEIKELREKMLEKGMKTDKKILKRLEILEDFKNSKNKPEWMILEVIPVIPPELRPMVQLEGGRFATSDLNDLYRRVINRNNRLKRLMLLNAPDIIIRNEKRMLQEAVDALFDNSRKKRAVKGAQNRPLKSLSDMLKGKQGRFRQNLLGKRVDYSGRSVIVVGPELKLHQAGLPKKMALELFKPFVMQKIVEKGYSNNIKSAKKLIDSEEEVVWGILEEVVENHPVFLNRAPTLHRLSIQAFEPVLIEGKAIRLHPLVCKGFNADFDGDQMAVHVPLSYEAQIENWMLMLSSKNLLSPANGKPIVYPSQDMVLGIGFLTKLEKDGKGEKKVFSCKEEAHMAFEKGIISLNALIKIRINNEYRETSLGRLILNEAFPSQYPFVNTFMKSKELARIIYDLYRKFGVNETAQTLDRLKEIGFHYSTYYGITIGIDDVIIPESKYEIISKANKEVEKIEEYYKNGFITNSERKNKVIDIWSSTNEKVTEEMLKELENSKNGFNPVYMMVDTGARGNKQQIRQLSGMRGLMAKPSGEIIELPVISNFKEGLTVLEYFISTHGARKGLSDTALKTSNAGYLTRRLIDVAQDVVIIENDCGTINGLLIKARSTDEEELSYYRNRIIGKISLQNIYYPGSRTSIVKANEEITEEKAEEIVNAGIDSLKVRSVLTCESKRGICRLCYGRDLGTGHLVEIGEAVGIIAAQSIGEPGTQLTLRTFHIGGTAHTEFEEGRIMFGYPVYIEKIPKRIIEKGNAKLLSRRGEIIYRQIFQMFDKKSMKLSVELNKKVINGEVIGTVSKKEKIIASHIGTLKEINDKYVIMSEKKVSKLKIGTQVFTDAEQIVDRGKLIAQYDAFNEPIITEHAGKIKFKDIIVGQTLKEEKDEVTGFYNRIIIKSKERELELQPRIAVIGDDGKTENYVLPYGANLTVKEGDKVDSGAIISKIPEQISKTKDITGGLPRVEDLIEARRPKDCAVVSEIDGTVEFGGIVKGKRIIKVMSDTGEEHKYYAPIGAHLTVHEGDMIRAGDPLNDGPIDPEDILKIKGDQALQEYLLNEIQEVYRVQNVEINDKHIAVIIRQMMKKIEITDVGDTKSLIGDIVDKFKFNEMNEQVIKAGGRPAMGRPFLLGITKASLNTDSWISAASFQETTKVLTDAAIKAKIENLLGLKENVIIGHLIPAGTGLKVYDNIELDIPDARLQKAKEILNIAKKKELEEVEI